MKLYVSLPAINNSTTINSNHMPLAVYNYTFNTPTASSLDWGSSGQTKFRTRSQNSESISSVKSWTKGAGGGVGVVANNLDDRPMLPIPRSSSHSSLEKHRVGASSAMASSLPDRGGFNSPPRLPPPANYKRG